MKKTLGILILVLFCILINIRWYLFDENQYQREQQILGISRSHPEATQKTEEVRSFLQKNMPLSDYFNEKEKQHLEDVQQLIFKGSIMLIMITLLLPLVIYNSRKDFKSCIFWAGVILLIVPLLLFLFPFPSLFLGFHKIFFTNDLWLLNPETDKLISLFPEQFFRDTFLLIGRNIFLSGVMLMTISYVANHLVYKDGD